MIHHPPATLEGPSGVQFDVPQEDRVQIRALCHLGMQNNITTKPNKPLTARHILILCLSPARMKRWYVVDHSAETPVVSVCKIPVCGDMRGRESGFCIVS